MMFNALGDRVPIHPAPIPQGKEGWYRAIDTAQAPPQDIAAPGAEDRVTRDTYLVAARSMVVLLSR